MAKEKKPKLADIAVTPEPLTAASVDRPNCQKCALFTKCDAPFKAPLVPKNYSGKILVVDSITRDKTDPVLQKILKLRDKAGYAKNDFAFTGVVRCGSADSSMVQTRLCRPFLLETIKTLNPRYIIGIGSNALRGLSNDGKLVNVTKNRGKLINIPGTLIENWGDDTRKALITYEPEKLLTGSYHLQAEIIKDLQRVAWVRMPYPKVGLPATAVKAIDTEFDPEGNLLTVGFACPDLADSLETVGNWKAIASRSLRETKVIIGHSVAGDIDMLIKNGLPVREEWLRGKNVLDSHILARIADENRAELGKGAFSLEALLLASFNVEPWKAGTDAKLKDTGDARDWTTEERTARCTLDAWGSYILAKHYLKAARPELRAFIHRVVFTLHRLGLAGAKVDQTRFHELGEDWKTKALQAGDLVTRAALTLGMEQFIPTNKNHVRDLLVNFLKLPLTEKTKSGLVMVDKTTLKQFTNDNETVKLLLEYSKYQKLQSTWYGGENEEDEEENGNRKKSIAELVDSWGLLHFWINALGARTGRRSSGGGEEGVPESRNSQNWPVIARSIIVSRFPNGKIGAHDYKSLEPVLYGWVTQDSRLLDYFYNGNGYLDIARDVLKKKLTKEDTEYKLIKSMTLGIFYNMGEWKMAKDFWDKLGIKLSSDWDEHLRLVTELKQNKFMPLFPGLKRYIHNRIEEMKRTQQVVAPDGYIRHLPHNGEPDKGASRKEKGYWKHLQNTAVNFPIQHMASMVTGSALMDIESALLREHGISLRDWHEMLLHNPLDLPCSVIINEVHDEVTTDYKPETYAIDKEIVFTMMAKVPSLKRLVPSFNLDLKLEAKIGPAWAVNEVET